MTECKTNGRYLHQISINVSNSNSNRGVGLSLNICHPRNAVKYLLQNITKFRSKNNIQAVLLMPISVLLMPEQRLSFQML